jgi:hypothetical protein
LEGNERNILGDEKREVPEADEEAYRVLEDWAVGDGKQEMPEAGEEALSVLEDWAVGGEKQEMPEADEEAYRVLEDWAVGDGKQEMPEADEEVLSVLEDWAMESGEQRSLYANAAPRHRPPIASPFREIHLVSLRCDKLSQLPTLNTGYGGVGAEDFFVLAEFSNAAEAPCI